MAGWRDRVLAATAAVRIADGGPVIGTAVLIEQDRLLTCRHVISADASPTGPLRPIVRVTFPGYEPLTAVPAENSTGIDAIVLSITQDESARGQDSKEPLPTPVRISGSARPPQEVELIGYPTRDNTQDGLWRSFNVQGPTASGQIQLGWLDTGSMIGHSGGPVVNSNTGELVGILREGSEHGRFDRYIPIRRLLDHGLLRWTPWLFSGDDAIGHFSRRSQGHRGTGDDAGDLFQGRTAALVAITNWLSSNESPTQALVISGQPGGGKSAVIARASLAVLRLKQTDSNWNGLLFHARMATISDFRKSVADLIDCENDHDSSSLLEEIDTIGSVNSYRRWVIVVDALDEAFSRGDRVGIAALMNELARRPWVRAVVASRPLAAGGPFAPTSLLRQFGVRDKSARNLIDLDSETYYHNEDVVSFVQTLLTKSNLRYKGPSGVAWQGYLADPSLTRRVAAAISAHACRNFLIAALTAVQLSEQEEVIDPARAELTVNQIPTSLGEALDLYLETRSDPYRFRGILTALAYAEGSGMNDTIWRLSSRALGYPVSQSELDDLRNSAIADYLLETNAEDGGRVTRLFHQALNDALLESRERRRDQVALCSNYRRFVDSHGGWQVAEPYLLRHISDHAVQADLLSELTSDVDFLLSSELASLNARATRMRPASRPTESWVTIRAGTAAYGITPAQRACLLSIVAAHLGQLSFSHQLAERANIPLWPVWAHTLGSAHTLLTGHAGGVQAVAAVPMPDGRTLIASGSTDYSLRLWDPDTGQVHGQPLIGHSGRVQAVAAASMPDGSTLVVSGSTDHTLRLWDAESAQPIGQPLAGHTDWVQAVAIVPAADGLVLIASAGDDGTVRLWEPTTGSVVRQMLVGDAGPVWALAVLETLDGRSHLVSGGKDGVVRQWDPETGLLLGQPMSAHSGGILSLAVIPMLDGRCILASGGQDSTIRLWDPEACLPIGRPIGGHDGCVWALTPVPIPNGQTLIASGGDEGSVKLRDPSTGAVIPNGQLTGHTGPVEAIAAASIPDGRTILASAGTDGSIRLCDADVGLSFDGILPGHSDWVWAMTAVKLPGGTWLLASGGTDATVRLWDPRTGRPVGDPITGHQGPIWAVASTSLPNGQTIVASAGYGNEIRLWDAATGAPVGPPLDVALGIGAEGQEETGVEALCPVTLKSGNGDKPLIASASTDGSISLWDIATALRFGNPIIAHTGMTRALAAVPMKDGRTLLASAGQDMLIRLWDPATGQAVGAPLAGHKGPVSALTVIPSRDGQSLLASGSLDMTVRLWDPSTGEQVGVTMAGHTGRIRTVAAVPVEANRFVIASSGADAELRLWDPSSTRQIGSPMMLAESATSMVSLDGYLVIAAEHAICAFNPRVEMIV